MPAHSSLAKPLIQILDHWLHIVDTFLKKEAVDEPTCPVAVGIHSGQIDPKLLQHVHSFIDLIRLVGRQNRGIDGSERHASDYVIMLARQLLVLEQADQGTSLEWSEVTRIGEGNPIALLRPLLITVLPITVRM